MEHHVYFWLKPEHQSPEDRARFEEGLDSLFAMEQVSGGLWSVPAAVEPRPVLDQSWTYAISIRFDSLEDHNAYQKEPAHLKFLETFKPWWEKVLVTDLA
jgi:hypothetical protein